MPGPKSSIIRPLRQFHSQVDIWLHGRLWLQVLVGIAAGVGTGLLLGPDMELVDPGTASVAGDWLRIPGRIFLGLIGIALIPLVGISVIKGITSAPSGAALRSVGGRLLAFVVVTTVIAGMIGIAVADRLRPGDYIDVDLGPPAQVEVQQPPTIAEFIIGLLPTNPEQAVVSRDMLAVVILAVIVGLAMRAVSAPHIATLAGFFDGVLEVAMVIVRWAMFLTPFAVFGLTANLVATTGIGTLAGLLAYVATVLVGLLLLLVVYLVALLLLGRMNPLRFFASIGDVLLLAFSTSSSAAVMPLSMNAAVRRLGVPENVANLVIPMGATINMAGTALYQSVAVIFLAQLSGVTLDTAQQAAIVTTIVLASIGAPGTPGVSIVILTSIVADLGLSTAGIALLLGVDRILDMSRTTVNVTGDLVAAVILRRTRTEEAAESPAAVQQPG